MKQLAVTSIIIGVVIQCFYSFGTFFLPSMASAEEVALYPPFMRIAADALYRFMPYGVFWIGYRKLAFRSETWRTTIGVSTVIGVFSPLLFVALHLLGWKSASEFRENFWPIRPLVQLSFFVVAAGVALVLLRKKEENV